MAFSGTQCIRLPMFSYGFVPERKAVKPIFFTVEYLLENAIQYNANTMIGFSAGNGSHISQ